MPRGDARPRLRGARELGLPEVHMVAIVLTVGYPESKESMHRGIVRTAISDLVHAERW